MSTPTDTKAETLSALKEGPPRTAIDERRRVTSETVAFDEGLWAESQRSLARLREDLQKFRSPPSLRDAWAKRKIWKNG
jgi:hypothetical protein